MADYYSYDNWNGLKIGIKDKLFPRRIINRIPYYVNQKINLIMTIEKLGDFDDKSWGKYQIYEKLPGRNIKIIEWEQGRPKIKVLVSEITNSVPTSGEGSAEFRLVRYNTWNKNNTYDVDGITLFHAMITSQDRKWNFWKWVIIGGLGTPLLALIVKIIFDWIKSKFQ